MEWEGHLPVHRHLPDRRVLRALDPGFGYTLATRLGDDCGIVRVEEDAELRRVELFVIGDTGRRLDLVGVVKQNAEIADAADAGFRTHRRLTRFDSRIAEDAFLGFAGLPVVINLLVRAAGDAHAPPAALLLVNKDDAVLFSLVDRARGAGGDAGWIEAVLAEPRQIQHEGLLELAVDFLLNIAEIIVGGPLREFPAENLLPVGPPFDLRHALAGDLRDGTRRRRGLRFRRVMQILVLEVEWLVVVVNFGQIGIGEDVGKHAPLAAKLGDDFAADLAPPAALPAVLVLPVLWIADAGLGLDIVEPGVFDTLACGPDILACHGAGVAADAFVEVQDLANLRTNLHSAASLYKLFSASGLSFQSTSRILRMMTNSSRLEPTVP